VVAKNPYVAAAKFVMSKREPEREAKKVAQAIAEEIGKFMVAQAIPTLESAGASRATR
jgi:ethanolamine utilization protein EutA (predicted chaperonin)